MQNCRAIIMIMEYEYFRKINEQVKLPRVKTLESFTRHDASTSSYFVSL